MDRYASYLSPKWGLWAQYCKQQAGFYPEFPKKLKRKLEIAAHQEGVKQLHKRLQYTPEELQKAAL